MTKNEKPSHHIPGKSIFPGIFWFGLDNWNEKKIEKSDSMEEEGKTFIFIF